MINTQYKKDFDGHYMIITNEIEKADYSLKMQLNNKIKGLLNLELHIVDNINQYYYDITSKHSLTQVLDNSTLGYEQVKKIMIETIGSIETGKEYLLSENDFVLDPDYIYINSSTYEVSLCYLVGYQQDITNQLSRMIEYLMNKVDYNDEQGVIFIYGLYKISKDECPTFDNLKEFINSKNKKEKFIDKQDSRIDSTKVITKTIDIYNTKNDKGTLMPLDNDKLVDKNRSKINLKIENKIKDKKNKNKKHVIPVMEERLESEEEVLVYSGKIISFSAFSIIVYIALILFGYKFNLYQNNFNGNLDIIKMFGYLLVFGTIEVYLLSKLLHKKNKIPKIKGRIEYINDIIEFKSNSQREKESKDLINSKNSRENIINYGDDDSQNKIFIEYNEENRENKTVLLDDFDSENTMLLLDEETNYVLKSVNPIQYKDIRIIEFPFFLGKLNDQVEKSVNYNVISRFHAKIDKKGEAFFITDLNSTNGTYLNNDRLKENEPNELHLNDEVKLANISYLFEISKEAT